MLPLLLLCNFLPILSHPLVSVVYKKQFPPIIVSSGVILNENHILTTTHPVCAHDYSRLCVLPHVEISEMLRYQYEFLCYDIKTMKFPLGVRPVELVAIQLVKDLVFRYGNNVAQFPLHPPTLLYYSKMDSITKRAVPRARHCDELILLRDSRNISGFYVRNFYASKIYTGIFPGELLGDETQFTETAKTSKYFTVYHGNNIKLVYCSNHNGAPLMCDYEVFGIMIFKSVPCRGAIGFQPSCLYDCAAVENSVHINLLHEEAQKFIRQFIRGAEPYEEAVKKELLKTSSQTASGEKDKKRT